MNQAVERMVAHYDCSSVEDYTRALHEVIQQIALLGLWRAKFFEHAAFYGGSALRILYDLDRFSEDLDFSLLVPDPTFSLSSSFASLERELASFGFSTTITSKTSSAIDSAFIKANTLEHLIKIGYTGKYHKDGILRIKVEVDRDPPQRFATEVKVVLQPAAFAVRSYSLPSLFAGKLHALLFRKWGNRVKGRDWYDFVWYISQGVPVNLAHLNERVKQSEGKSSLDANAFGALLNQRIAGLNIENAQLDIRPFVRDPAILEVWSHDFFHQVAARVKTVQEE